MTGRFKLVLLELGVSSQSWWVDKPSLISRSIAWDGRGVVDDPWKSNDARWTPFEEIHNQESGGVIFPYRGTELQVRGQALTQVAEIDRVQFKPKYAELGAIPDQGYPDEQKTPTGGSITSSWSQSTPGGSPPFTRLFTATSSSTYGFIPHEPMFKQWNFGDGGIGYGNPIIHTYAASGTYTVTLVVTDRYGYQNTYSNTVAV